MSVISNRHTIVPFVAGTTSAFADQRLAKVGYKTTKKQAAKFPSVAVSVPVIPEAFILRDAAILVPYVRTMLENAQDGIVRSLYESSAGCLSEVSDDELSIDSCIAFLAAEENGSRLKKETIEAWFDSEISENLTVLVAEKLGFTELTSRNTPTIENHVKIYRDVISILAGGKTILAEQQIKGCRVAIALAADDAGIADRLLKRLDAMQNKPKIEELLEL